ncbi:MAG: hypothetical protein ACTSP4_13355 [Candidatus Hodarchaeales archaeon]
MKRVLFSKIIILVVLLLFIPQKIGFISENTNDLRPNYSIVESTFKVTIERIYLVDDKDPDVKAEGDVYLTVWKDTNYLADFGGISSGDYKINSNSFKQMNLDIYSTTISGTTSSINITIRARDYDIDSDHDELGIVEYIIPSLSEGEFHHFEGESSDHNMKIWFLTTYGGSPQYHKFHSSFVLNNLYIIDDTDSTSSGDIRIEVLFNGLPQDSQYYPTADPYEWQIETGNYQPLNINLTADLATENYVPYSHVIIMVWDRDSSGWPSYDEYYSTLGYIEINMTTDFSVNNQEYTTVIPGSSGKAKFYITASMSRFPPSVEISDPINTTYAFNNIQFKYNIEEYDSFTIWLDNIQNNTISDNSTWILSDGVHNFTIVAYNVASEITSTVIFTIDITSPIVTIDSPSNTTYTSSSILLTYSISEIATATIYLDGVDKGFIASGDTISDLIDGCHNLTILVIDNAGHKGIATVWFSIEITSDTSQSSLLTSPGFTMIHILLLTALIGVYVRRRKKREN